MAWSEAVGCGLRGPVWASVDLVGQCKRSGWNLAVSGVLSDCALSGRNVVEFEILRF